MKQLYYNRLSSYRTKNIVMSTFSVVISYVCFMMIPAFYKPMKGFHDLLITILIVTVILVLFRSIPYEQVIESSQNKTFLTYYKLGPFRFKLRQWDRVTDILLEQDQKRFYCLVIRTSSGQVFQIERYPALKQANEKLTEIKALFD